MGVAYDGGIKVFYSGCDVRLDRIGYPSCGGAFRAGYTFARTLFGLVASRLLRALYRDHLAPIKHNGMFLRGRVREIYLFLLAHRLRFSNGILKEVRLTSTFA